MLSTIEAVAEQHLLGAAAQIVLPDLEQALIRAGWSIHTESAGDHGGTQLWASKGVGRLHFPAGAGQKWSPTVVRVRAEERGTAQEPGPVEVADWRIHVTLSTPLTNLLELAEYVARP